MIFVMLPESILTLGRPKLCLTRVGIKPTIFGVLAQSYHSSFMIITLSFPVYRVN